MILMELQEKRRLLTRTSMKWKLGAAPVISLVIFFIIFTIGCSGVKQETRAPAEKSKITEEDVPETTAPARRSEESPEQQSQTFSGPPAEPVESPQTGEPGQRQKRRYIYTPGEGAGPRWQVDKSTEREQQ
jgi:hypothetical protein